MGNRVEAMRPGWAAKFACSLVACCCVSWCMAEGTAPAGSAVYADQASGGWATSTTPPALPGIARGERHVMPSHSAPPRPRPMIAVDVDETLCVTDYNSLLWGIGKDDSRPLPEAQATLSRLAGSFDIIYVTARPRSLADATEQWLSKHSFPTGRIVTSPTLGDFILQSDFKRNVFRQLRLEYPNMLIGIGDKVKDAEAYRVNGMVPVIVNPWRGHAYHANDIICRDWSAVRAFFDANRATLSDPQRLIRLSAGDTNGLNRSNS